MLYLFLALFGAIWFFIVEFVRSCFRKSESLKSKPIIGIFHPYCNAGGGGERVLWVALKFLMEKFPNWRFIVYTGDTDVSSSQIIENAKTRFNICIPQNVEFIFLQKRHWVEAERYPYFTLLGQSIGSILLGLEAISYGPPPDLFFDTMGYAFVYPLFKLLCQSQIACYVHYPTISTDMLSQVSNRVTSYNNSSIVSRSVILSSCKLTYYKLFSFLYSFCGRRSDLILVNSSWTLNHIVTLWKCSEKIFKVFPPCDVSDFKKIKSENCEVDKIVSLAQFRPEKDHKKQINAFSMIQRKENVQLVLIGSVRNEGDENRVKELMELVEKLGLGENVVFKINVSYEELKKELAQGLIGLHTMWNEHFGIGVVELMAAGLIMIAHKSGGPLMDIVVTEESQRNGFLASTAQEYAQVISHILDLSANEKNILKTRAKSSVDRFSEESFLEKIDEYLTPYFVTKKNE